MLNNKLIKIQTEPDNIYEALKSDGYDALWDGPQLSIMRFKLIQPFFDDIFFRRCLQRWHKKIVRLTHYN